MKRCVIYLVLFLLTGCATYRPSIPPSPPEGIYHQVKEGETLWRIAFFHGVDWRELMRINNIKEPTQLKAGDVIFIPGAKEVREVKTYSIIEIGEEKKFLWPAKGKIINYFGKGAGRDPRGINISVKPGEKVKASKSGEVIFAGNLRGYQGVVMINHGDGFITVYAGNSKLLVKEGEWVRQGQVIAISGENLHFEIRERDEARNPLDFLD